ncbi:MAG: secretin N-terminal domain-containing protein [Bryobacteraceae bacterium]
MRLPIVVAAIMITASLVIAQEKPESFEAVVIPVKTLSGDSFNRLVRLLGVFGAKFSADDKLRTIVVYAPKDVVSQMRRVIEQLDQPGSEAAIGRNIELTLSFLRCFTTAQPNTRLLPPDLEPAAKQLRAATQYKEIVLWDTLPLHIQEGKETTHSFCLPDILPNQTNAVSTAQVRLRPEAVVRKDSGRYVRFDRMNIAFKIPHITGSFVGVGGGPQFSYMEVGLDTAGDFKEGQKTVLGKISGIDDESAVFVVIALKILD